MSDNKKRIQSLAREAALLPQEEVLQISERTSELVIGIPKEESFQEKRVALVPEAVALLVARGHQVLVESGAGEQAHYQDSDYSESGARIVYDRRQVFQTAMVIKVEPPTLEEVGLMGMRQTLISALQWTVQSEGVLEALAKKKTTAIAWDFLQNANGIFPLVRAMGEIAGNTSVLIAGELLAGPKAGERCLVEFPVCGRPKWSSSVLAPWENSRHGRPLASVRRSRCLTTAPTASFVCRMRWDSGCGRAPFNRPYCRRPSKQPMWRSAPFAAPANGRR